MRIHKALLIVINSADYNKSNSSNKRLRWSRGSALPLVSKFAGSNPAEAVRIFKGEKSSARLPSEGK